MGVIEQTNEDSLLRWLDELGWEVYGGPDHHGNGGALINDAYDRSTDEDILWQVLREKLIEFNSKVTADNVESVVTGIKGDLAVSGARPLLEVNRVAHNMLTRGRQTTLQQPGSAPIKTNVGLIDFENPERNSFIAANQVHFNIGGRTIIPDVTLFVNGIPIVQGELKSSGQGARITDAIRNLRTYEATHPKVFRTVLFNFAAETHKYYVGGVEAPREQYHPWSQAPPEYSTDNEIEQFKQGARATLNKPTLLNILQNYVFFEEGSHGIAKIVPRHMQYYAVENLRQRVQNGVSVGERTRGLVWHTQGSGKSFTMLYAADQLIEADWLSSPQVLLLVDQDELREQMSTTLKNIGYSHRFEVADSMDHLYELIQSGVSKIILTTIHMFEEAPQGLQTNENTVILTDEAHRYMEKKLGNRLEGALPDAHHYGFTGTPVSDKVRNTFLNYSNGTQSNGGRAYMDHYSVQDGIEDGVILPVHFEVRTDIAYSVDDIGLDEEFEEETAGLPEDRTREIIQETVTSRQLSELDPRVEALSADIHDHFQEKIAPNDWKGMVVLPSRDAAIKYGKELQKHFDDPDDVRVMISEAEDNTGSLPDVVVPEDKQEGVRRDFKKEESPKLLVVCDKLLVGFDAPVLKAMYLDRNLEDHRLLQAQARVNRPDEGKCNGLIVDYRGALSNLEEALEYDDDVIEEEIVAEEGELMSRFEELLEDCVAMFSSDLQVDTQEDITQLVSEVAHRSEEFKENIKRLQNVYESLSPHGDLVEYEKTYETLNRIRLELESIEDSEDGGLPTKERWGEKTLDLIEDHMEIDTVGQKYPTFELGSETLDEIADVPPEINVIRVGKGLQEIIERERQSNPRYNNLSERLEEVLDRWNQDMQNATKTLNALKEIEEHVEDLQDQGEHTELNKAEYAIYLMLQDEYSDWVATDEKAEVLAKEIEIQFQDTVQRDFLGWKTNPDTQKEIREAVITALTECDALALYTENDDFVDNCVKYLVENHN